MRSATRDLSGDPIARGVLARLADMYPPEVPLGSFARTVMSGEMTLLEAASHRWHGDALAVAVAEATDTRRGLSEEQNVEIQRAAERLRALADESAEKR